MSDLGNKKIMARNIQYYMQKKGKTRREVCEDLGLKYTTFTSWVTGEIYPRIDKIEMLANYFGVSKADLVESHVAGVEDQLRIIPVNPVKPRQIRSSGPRIASVDLTIDEKSLIRAYRNLNDDGKEIVSAFTIDIASDPEGIQRRISAYAELINKLQKDKKGGE